MSIAESVPPETVPVPLSVPHWRRAVTRSQLPNGAKLTLLEHANRGFGRYHNPTDNLHGVTVDRLVLARGISRRSVQYHLRLGLDAGFLHRHEGGWRGHQQVFHYAIPVGKKGATHYTLSGCESCTPSSTYVANATGENNESSIEESAVVPSLRSVPPKEPHVEPVPPESMYAAIPIVVFTLTRLARLTQEQTMTADAFQNDQPLPLPGVTELGWPPEATTNGCRQAWHQGWQATHDGPPDPTFIKRAMNKITQAAKDRTDLETWRNLWCAARDAGKAGVWNVDNYLGAPPPSRYAQRGNKYVDVVQGDVSASMGILGFDQQREIGA